MKDFNTAIKLNPREAFYYSNRGVVYYRKGDFDNAIKDYTKVIQINPSDAEGYSNRGEVWLHLQEWEKAKSDLTTAKNMGLDIIASFHNEYTSVADFEQKTGIQLPPDITALLAPA